MRKDMHHHFGHAFEGNKASVHCNSSVSGRHRFHLYAVTDIMPHNGLSPREWSFRMRKDMHHHFGPIRLRAHKASVRCNGYYITQRTEPRYRSVGQARRRIIPGDSRLLSPCAQIQIFIISHNGISPVSGALDEKGDVPSRSTRP